MFPVLLVGSSLGCVLLFLVRSSTRTKLDTCSAHTPLRLCLLPSVGRGDELKLILASDRFAHAAVLCGCTGLALLSHSLPSLWPTSCVIVVFSHCDAFVQIELLIIDQTRDPQLESLGARHTHTRSHVISRSNLHPNFHLNRAFRLRCGGMAMRHSLCTTQLQSIYHAPNERTNRM